MNLGLLLLAGSGLLKVGSTLLKSKKLSNLYEEKIVEDNSLLNELLDKKKLMYMKSGFKISGSVLNDLNSIRKKGMKGIDKLRGEKDNLWLSSILGIPLQIYNNFGNDYLKKDLFSKSLLKKEPFSLMKN